MIDHFIVDELPERDGVVNGATKCPICYDHVPLTDDDDPDEAIILNCGYKCGLPVGQRWVDQKECVLLKTIEGGYPKTPKPKKKKKWTPKKKKAEADG